MSHHGQWDVSNWGHRCSPQQQAFWITAGGDGTVHGTHLAGSSGGFRRYQFLHLACEADWRRVEQYEGFHLMGVPVLRCVLGGDGATQGMADQDDPVGSKAKGKKQVVQEPGAFGKRLLSLGPGATALTRPIV